MMFIDEKYLNDTDHPSDHYKDLSQKISQEPLLDSPVRTSGTQALVEQRAWIQNKTIRDIILFGEPMNETKYQAALSACQLT